MSGRGSGDHSAGGGTDPAAGAGFDRAGPALRPGREFDLIRAFAAGAARGGSSAVRLGIGDDCAILEAGRLAVSTDLTIEDVHFSLDWLTPAEIGYRATAAAISDLAAVAARPVGVLVSLGLSLGDDGTTAREIMSGVVEAVEGVGGELLGGDLSGSPGPIVIDVVAIGTVRTPVLRGGASPGDEIWVTGRLGGAAAAVRAWKEGREPVPSARRAFARPTPRVREAAWLAERSIPRAMIDLSDGLGGDIGHIAAASAVGAVLDHDAIPLAEGALAQASAAEAVSLALSGGEDYELCFVAEAGRVQEILDLFSADFDTPLSLVGRVERGAGVTLLKDGERTPLADAGFQHFGGPT